MMKKILGIAALIMIIGVSTATEIRFSPDSWEIGKWCIVATDIVINTDNVNIAATDIIIESSLDFMDFVPTKLFPYFLPPKTSNGITHIVWFTTDPKHRVQWSWIIGTLYMKQQWYEDRDGTIRFYMKKKWDTTDTNLSIAWWIDILDIVWSWYYTFTDDWACVHYAGEAIPWWISESSLNKTISKIRRNVWMQKIFTRKNLGVFTWLLLISLVLFLYYKKSKQWQIA